MANEKLLDRAHKMEEWLEDHFLDHNGVVYTYLDTKTSGPTTQATFPPDQAPIRLPDVGDISDSDWHNYENCGMTTAAYLKGLLWRYEVEKDPVALKRAGRCFQTLDRLYEIGKQLEEGFFPKIYGDRFSEQTSTDQVLYVMLALDHYSQHCNETEKTRASHMITELIRFWAKRDYRYKYFWYGDDFQWPLGRFPSLLLMGYKHSGDPFLKKEYDRLLAMGVNEHAIELRLESKLHPPYEPSPYEKAQNAWLIGELDGSTSMDIMELDYCLLNDPSNRWAPNWRNSIREVWNEAKLVLVPDGTMYVHVLVDMKTGQPRRPEPAFFREPDGAHDWIGFRYAAGARSPDSTFIARAGVQGYQHVKDADIRDASRLVIMSLDQDDLRSYLDPSRYLPELKHRTQLYSGDGITNWLWGYWQGRAQGVFAADEGTLPSPKHDA